MILNHASLAPAGWRDALGYLPDLADGMAVLIRTRTAQSTLRMSRSLHETYWPNDGSLFDAFREVMRQGKRDQSLFLMKLSEKAPLLSNLAPDGADRFWMCEAKTLPPDDGAPLVLCAVTGAICVGFPSEPVWDRDQLPVDFLELLSDGTLAGRARRDRQPYAVGARRSNRRSPPHAASTSVFRRNRLVEPAGADIPTPDVRPRRGGSPRRR